MVSLNQVINLIIFFSLALDKQFKFQVPNYSRTNGRHFSDSSENYSTQPVGGQTIPSSTSIPPNPIYNLPEPIHHSHGNPTETSMTICPNKESSSSSKMSSAKGGRVVIKQDLEPFYDSKMCTSFNESENTQV